MGRVWRLRASDAEEIPSASSGEVVGLAATPEEPLPAIRAGDTLLEDGAPVLRLAKMKFPEPVDPCLDREGRRELSSELPFQTAL